MKRSSLRPNVPDAATSLLKRTSRSRPELSVRAHRRSPKGAVLAVHVAAHGWPAIIAVGVVTTCFVIAYVLKFVQ